MSKFKNVFAAAAAEIFKDHPNLDQIFITSDGQGFTDEEKAKDNARYHKDKTIQSFERGFEDNYQEDANPNSEGSNERQALMKEYEGLFGTPAARNIGIPKLKERIAEKKKELGDASQS